MQTFVRRASLALLLLALGTPAVALADTITYRSGTARPLDMEVVIQGLDPANNELKYVSRQSGTAGHKPLEQIVTIKAQNEKTLSDAEEAFAAGKWDDAARLYSRALDSDRDWVRSRAVVRLVEAANKSGQFGPAAKAYVELIKVNPATAATIKPTVPTDKPDAVKPAMDDVDRALGGQLQPTQKELLQNFKAELLIASGRGADAQKMLSSPTAAPAAPNAPAGQTYAAATPADANQRHILADRALLAADQAMRSKDYPRVVSDIEASKTAFVDPVQQAKALYLVAQAKEQLAGADPAKLQDAAIAYMRVVAHFEGKPAGADVPASLWKVAEIQERLKNTDEALQVYTQLANDPKLKGSPIATSAAQKVAALKK
jgi:tetratricopeptide (TPR) repeat protein